MDVLETRVVHHKARPRFLKLCQGDLADIRSAEAVDLLMISAFPNDYTPTRSSLIGALQRRGVSVAGLAKEMEVDLRRVASCWLSKDLREQYPDLGFRRILCFEPTTKGSAPQVVGDVFRAILPFAFGETPIRSIAMPLLAAGDQGEDPQVMLHAIVEAAAHWLERGLPIDTIIIVLPADSDAGQLRGQFASMPVQDHTFEGLLDAPAEANVPYDFFVSYAHADKDEADALVEAIAAAKPSVRIFQDKLVLQVGDAWQSELDRALEQCRKVIALYSPSYLESKMCMEEFNMARLRHRETAGGVLLPLYVRSTSLPLYMRSLQYLDCREGDLTRLRTSTASLVESIVS